MKVNGIEIVEERFAYDGCHKIYLIECIEDEIEAVEYGYEILPIERLEETFKKSCGLEFIRNWSLNRALVGQFEDAVFEY